MEINADMGYVINKVTVFLVSYYYIQYNSAAITTAPT